MIQKKNDGMKTFTIKGAKLFKDDIEFIMNKLSQRSLKLIISDDDSVFDSLNELVEIRGKHPRKFELKGTHDTILFATIWIAIKKDEISVTTYGSEELTSLSYEIRDYLNGKVRFYYRVLDPSFWVGAGSLLILMLSVSQSKPNGTINGKWALYLSIVCFFIAAVSFGNRRLTYSVHLARKHESGFFRRNSDAVILMIMSAVVVGVITLVTTWMTD